MRARIIVFILVYELKYVNKRVNLRNKEYLKNIYFVLRNHSHTTPL